MNSYLQRHAVSPHLVGRILAFCFLSLFITNSSVAQENKAKTDGANRSTANAASTGGPISTTGVNVSTGATSLAKPQSLVAGDRCTGDPKFLEKIGFSKRALVDTTSTHRVGLLVTDVGPQGQRGRSTQHESWTQAGYLGRVQRDRDGNVYTYPAPSVTLVYNPVEKSNIIYRIDSETGVMAPFVELPKESPATEQNPFGVLSLALDCEGNALYASSVYGSTASSEKGVIARIDLATKEVKVLKRGVDALSLLVAFDGRGKRLYAGSARENVVFSQPIKIDGSLGDEEMIDVRLDDIAAARDKRARVLRVDGRGRLYVRAIPFEYNLVARTTIPTTEMQFSKSADKSGTARFVLAEQREIQVPVGRVATLGDDALPPRSAREAK